MTAAIEQIEDEEPDEVTINSLISAAFTTKAKSETDEQITRRVMKEVAKQPDPCAKFLWPLVLREVTRYHRDAVRTLEHLVAAVSGPGADPLAARKQLFVEYMFTGELWVAWGQATVEDHKNRIAYLNRLTDGLNLTISRHRRAIEEIEAAKVKCLDDLPKRAKGAAWPSKPTHVAPPARSGRKS